MRNLLLLCMLSAIFYYDIDTKLLSNEIREVPAYQFTKMVFIVVPFWIKGGMMRYFDEYELTKK